MHGGCYHLVVMVVSLGGDMSSLSLEGLAMSR